jgi:hypothetical protein
VEAPPGDINDFLASLEHGEGHSGDGKDDVIELSEDDLLGGDNKKKK